jgi:hypothetical protein
MATKSKANDSTVMMAVYDEAMTNCILHGFGLIRIINEGSSLEFSAVHPNEYRDLAEMLIWASNHTVEVPVQ